MPVALQHGLVSMECTQAGFHIVVVVSSVTHTYSPKSVA